ncbi:MAG TPA: NAD(P)/FAD-dependent oxidoreductase [Vicinamibacterales bacterium]|nr:NAD(P)/FAD-dependent oxidoreductase [Vicinamibacterales bacterium]
MGVQGPQVLTASTCDVVVAGGGPAGLLAARDLAAGGLHVILLEEHERIGDPVHCTGVLGLDAFDELRLSRASILSVVQSARFVSAAGTEVAVETDHVRAAVVDRARFDSGLAAAAADAGARVRTGVRVRRIEAGPSGVTVTASDGQLGARAAIVACGASYGLNRTLGLGLPRLLLHSAQVEVPFPPLGHIEVHLGRSVAPGGFAWIVPFRRGFESFARVGLFCSGDAQPRFDAFAERVCARFDVDRHWPSPRIKVLPLAPVSKTWTERVLAVGDAAGLVKPTTGGGIYYGLLTGGLAAEVLIEALGNDRLDPASLGEYERRWRRRLGSEIRAGLIFRRAVASLPDPAIEALIDLARVDGIVPLLKRTADFNWHGSAAMSLLRHVGFRRLTGVPEGGS